MKYFYRARKGGKNAALEAALSQYRMNLQFQLDLSMSLCQGWKRA